MVACRIARSRRAAVSSLLFTALVVSVSAARNVAAQVTTGGGRIVGRVVDATTGQGIIDAGVQVVGTTQARSPASTVVSRSPRVPAGTVTIQVRRIGFAPKTVTGLLLDAGQTARAERLALDSGTHARGAGRHRVGRTRHGERSARQAAHRGRRRQRRHRRTDQQEPGRRRGASGAARQRRDGAGRQVRLRARPRRAIYDGVAQRRARAESRSRRSASSRSTCSRRDSCSRSRRRRRSRPISRATSPARWSTSRRASSRAIAR